MYIIDRNRDYYDYLSHIYGVDKKVVFDRRGSTAITDGDIVNDLHDLRHYGILPIRKKSNYLILEVGYVQYLIEISEIKMRSTAFGSEYESCKMSLIHTYRENKHHFDEPLSLHEVSLGYKWNRKGKRLYAIDEGYTEAIDEVFRNKFGTPLLASTHLTKLIDAEDIWRELQTYISSLNNDIDVDLNMTDVEKAEIHGFDKKTSFRNPIK